MRWEALRIGIVSRIILPRNRLSQLQESPYVCGFRSNFRQESLNLGLNVRLGLTS